MVRNENFYGTPIGLTSNGKLYAAPIYASRAPLTSDYKYNLGQIWIYTTTHVAYMLVNVASNSATWNEIEPGVANLLSLTTDGATVVTPVSNNITLAGTANQITTSGSSGTVTFSLIGPYTPATYTAHGVLLGEGTNSIVASAVGSTGTVLAGNSAADPTFQAIPDLNYVTAAGPTQALANNTTYLATGSTLVSFALPTSPATSPVGSIIKIIGVGLGGWRITQASGQQVIYNTAATTAGTGGTLSSVYHTACLEMVCTTANTTWTVTSSPSTFTIV